MTAFKGYWESDDDCAGCGATAAERKREKPGSHHGLTACPYCDTEKCCMCDMGDDVECSNCPDDN